MDISATTSRLLWLLGMVAGYALLMSTNPIRASLRDGRRCLRRYRQIWGILAFCGVAAATFFFAVRCYEWRTVPGAAPAVTPWTGWTPVTPDQLAAECGLPALLSLAALFDCLVTLFPLSVLAAALFLVNWRGYQGVLYRGVVRRCGWAGGTVLHAGLVVCALASLLKPVLFFDQARLGAVLGGNALASLSGLDYWLSFAFEYFLGVGLQVYLALLCFGWVRGLTFDFDALGRFALRRCAFVLKWAAIVLTLSSLGINIPLILGTFQRGQPAWLTEVVAYSQIVLPLILLGFCSMQLALVFHNESLRRAFADHFRFWRRHGGRLLWLFLIGGMHFFLLALADRWLEAGGGASAWPVLVWRLAVYPVLWAILAGWLLASWVCLFRRCEANREAWEEPILF